ncbi:hypothetical protein DL95DRAFT_347455 [Leptodontidium sp. 2 PMI_412]|nr:hypothetical protein DL95DRAFT_347455 [Leptodontidium sp. 2 PMI_412]
MGLELRRQSGANHREHCEGKAGWRQSQSWPRTYNELSVYGRLRKINKLGAYSMFEKLLHVWGNRLSPQQIYEKVRFFSWNYAINRHKMTTITPAYHMEAYGCDDNRFDQLKSTDFSSRGRPEANFLPQVLHFLKNMSGLKCELANISSHRTFPVPIVRLGLRKNRAEHQADGRSRYPCPC